VPSVPHPKATRNSSIVMTQFLGTRKASTGVIPSEWHELARLRRATNSSPRPPTLDVDAIAGDGEIGSANELGDWSR
jgi:hypothetical protein